MQPIRHWDKLGLAPVADKLSELSKAKDTATRSFLQKIKGSNLAGSNNKRANRRV